MELFNLILSYSEFVFLSLYGIITITLWLFGKTVFGLNFFPFGFSTENWNKWVSSLATKYSTFWKNLGNFARKIVYFIVVLYVPLILIYFFDIFGYQEFFNLLTFGINLSFNGIIFYLLTFISILTHEIFHATVGEVNGIKNKKIGTFLVPGLLYGAYVKPDYAHSFNIEQIELDKMGGFKILKETLKNQDLKNAYGALTSAGLMSNIFFLTTMSLFKLMFYLTGLSGMSLYIVDQLYIINLSLVLINANPILPLDGRQILLYGPGLK